MNYRRLGRTGIMVSEVGFGTCQLRMVPADRAVQTLITGFNLGVNIVHTAPDYAGADEIVAEAIKATGSAVHVCANGWGSREQFEHLFENTRERFGKLGRSGLVTLDFFGIASVEDREILGENVWGPDGMVEFLTRMKRQGKLRHTFCTSHGAPAYIRRLIECGDFDAVMFAYNPLGYHMLSFNPPDDRGREAVAENAPLFEIAAAKDIGVMLMEVLGGGLLCRGGAFRARDRALSRGGEVPLLPSGSEVLRHLLRTRPSVACLLPGTMSVEEARENAFAGHGEHGPAEAAEQRIAAAVAYLESTACRRCGQCEPLCRHGLPVSWLFRAAAIDLRATVPFETPADKQYFDLHAPSELATCARCQDRTCRCPYGIDIPGRLTEAHLQMRALLARGEVPGPTPAASNVGLDRYGARLVSVSWNGAAAIAVVQNLGKHGWHLSPPHPAVSMQLRNDAMTLVECPLRADVPVAAFAYFAFETAKPTAASSGRLWLVLRHRSGELLEEIALGAPVRETEFKGSVAMQEIGEPTQAYAVRYLTHSIPATLPAGEICRASIELQNAGSQLWEPHPADGCAVNLTLDFGDDIRTVDLPGPVAPGEKVIVALSFDVPPRLGPAKLKIDMVRQKVAFFADLGSAPLMLLPDIAAEVSAGHSFALAAAQPIYGAEHCEHRLPASVAPRARFGLWARLRNCGSMQWDAHAGHGRLVSAVVTINEQVVASTALPHSVATAEEVDVHLVVPAPAEAGRHTLSVNLVHEGVAYFHAMGVPPLELPLSVQSTSVPAGAHLYDVALRSNSAFYHASGGLSRLADGTGLPQLLEHGKGCHVWDSDGRRYIDYTMGWGCALLGHGHDLVEAAVRRSMGCGPILPLPHRLELELTDALCQGAEIPCAEAVAFGKNGSDVCTLAVRLARLATGRRTVLVCGYHGWQDWYAEPLGFAGTGVPERDPHLVVRFGYNDTASVLAAISAHRADLAAVILEPSGAAGGPAMVGEDVDLAFLKTVAAETRAAGALLVFDEIITGFRYLGGSVQKATGIVPDLACFGKALGNGFPISALLGRRDLLRLMSRAFYGPTFKGELYSLAAARAALSVYRSEPVADHVWKFGRQLQAGLGRICQELGVDASVVGPPFRTALNFNATDPLRRRLVRTLYIQELLRGGLITYGGVMLPSYAHADAELAETLSVIELALRRVQQCCEAGDLGLHRAIEMPLLE